MFDIYEVMFEVYVEDRLTNKQVMQAPKEMIIINFVQLAEQIKKDKRPIMIKLIRPYTFWDNFEQKQKTINNEIALSNNAMDSWRENKNE
jgi:hypothetical protein